MPRLLSGPLNPGRLRSFLNHGLIAAGIVLVIAVCVTRSDARAPTIGPCVEALTDSRGRVLAGPELESLRRFYATLGLGAFLDFDYAIAGRNFNWLSDEKLIAVYASNQRFDGYRRLPRIGPTTYHLGLEKQGVPLQIIPQGENGFPVCVASRVVL